MEWRKIDDDARDGRFVEIVAFEDDGAIFEIHVMRWEACATNDVFAPGVTGMWVSPGEYTWREGEGGPTHYRRLAS